MGSDTAYELTGFDSAAEYGKKLLQTPQLFAKRVFKTHSAEEQMDLKHESKAEMKKVLVRWPTGCRSVKLRHVALPGSKAAVRDGPTSLKTSAVCLCPELCTAISLQISPDVLTSAFTVRAGFDLLGRWHDAR